MFVCVTCLSSSQGVAELAMLAGMGFGLYTILPIPISYGIYRNKGGSGGYNVLRNSVGDEGR